MHRGYKIERQERRQRQGEGGGVTVEQTGGGRDKETTETAQRWNGLLRRMPLKDYVGTRYTTSIHVLVCSLILISQWPLQCSSSDTRGSKPRDRTPWSCSGVSLAPPPRRGHPPLPSPVSMRAAPAPAGERGGQDCAGDRGADQPAGVPRPWRDAPGAGVVLPGRAWCAQRRGARLPVHDGAAARARGGRGGTHLQFSHACRADGVRPKGAQL